MTLHQSIIFILLPLAFAMSYFSIGLSNSKAGVRIRPGTSLKASIIFMFVTFILAVSGHYAGGMLFKYIVGDPGWVAFGLFIFTGFRIVSHGWKKKAWFRLFEVNKTSVILALAVALGINILFGTMALHLFQQTHMIIFSGAVAFASGLLAFSGLVYGLHFQDDFGWKAEIVGGIIIWTGAVWLLLG